MTDRKRDLTNDKDHPGAKAGIGAAVGGVAGGVAGGAAAGAAAGGMTGPVGAVVGAAVGAVVGAIAGRKVDPAVEDELHEVEILAHTGILASPPSTSSSRPAPSGSTATTWCPRATISRAYAR